MSRRPLPFGARVLLLSDAGIPDGTGAWGAVPLESDGEDYLAVRRDIATGRQERTVTRSQMVRV